MRTLMTVLLLAAVACAEDAIKVGHYNSLTGSEATFGQQTSNGIRLALKEFNDAGGLNGRKIELIEYDTKGDAREAGAVVTRLVARDHVVAVLGESASGLTLAGAPVCQEAGVPMITPSSTNPRITKVGDMIFRVCFIDSFQGYVGAKFIFEQKHVNRVAILQDQAAPYSVGLADEFEKYFKKLGGEIVTRQSYNSGDQDFTARLTTVRATNPEVVFVPGYYTDVANIALQARKIGINAPLLGGDGWDSGKLVEIAGKAIEGSFFSNHYSPEDPAPVIQEFLKRFNDEYGGRPDSGAALGYDAARLLFDSMKRAKSLSGKDLAAAIASTKAFQGVTGEITIDENRNAVKSAVILEMRDGTPRYVTTIKPQ